ncbi:MAG: RNA 2',3'-cyclic phosphodiesterase [Acidobacteria bacterium]|nr:RNA 2',3'-cyclic phosphodiesterase [Acidobacteriota bacterium]
MTQDRPLRLFVAVEMPPPVKDSLAEAARSARDRLPPARWIRPETAHLTLAFLGETPREQLPGIESALRHGLEHIPSFRAQVAGAGTFPPNGPARVAWVGLREIPLDPPFPKGDAPALWRSNRHPGRAPDSAAESRVSVDSEATLPERKDDDPGSPPRGGRGRSLEAELEQPVGAASPPLEMGGQGGFSDLERAVRLGLQEAIGFEGDGKPFRPHLTLARCRKPWPRAAVERFAELLGGFESEPFAVLDVALVASELRPDGPRYRTLARVPLGGEP